MTYQKKPWKYVKYRYIEEDQERDLVQLSEHFTKRFAFKKINKILFSSLYLDLVIGVKSGESLTIKNYFCPSCAQINYCQDLITKMYEEALLGLTCTTLIIRKITHYPSMEQTYHLQIEGLHNRREQICGFHGPIFINPRTK